MQTNVNIYSTPIVLALFDLDASMLNKDSEVSRQTLETFHRHQTASAPFRFAFGVSTGRAKQSSDMLFTIARVKASLLEIPAFGQIPISGNHTGAYTYIRDT